MRDVYLFTTNVVGSIYVEDILDKQRRIEIKSRLKLVREPKNPYDKRAIAVLNADGDRVGYIPKKDNLIFSRLMDGGETLYGLVVAKDVYEDDVVIQIDIFLDKKGRLDD